MPPHQGAAENSVGCAIADRLARDETVTHSDAWLAIPPVGYVVHQPRIGGRGDGVRETYRNMIFRCQLAGSRRMWFLIDTNPGRRSPM